MSASVHSWGTCSDYVLDIKDKYRKKYDNISNHAFKEWYKIYKQHNFNEELSKSMLTALLELVKEKNKKLITICKKYDIELDKMYEGIISTFLFEKIMEIVAYCGKHPNN